MGDNERTGKPVAVSIQSLSVAAVGEDEVGRSARTEEKEWVSAPVGDGLLLEMSMERDESALRATKLENGKTFRVIAVNSSDKKYVAHGDYTMMAGSPVPAGVFEVPTGGTYDFICYSYNNGDSFLPASYSKTTTLPALTVGNTKDLLWCKIASGKAVNSDADAKLSILLNHKLAKITVIVDCIYNGWTITGIASNKMSLGSVAVGGTINDLINGTLSNGTAGNPYIQWSTTTT
jgi:hypothetical protein